MKEIIKILKDKKNKYDDLILKIDNQLSSINILL